MFVWIENKICKKSDYIIFILVSVDKQYPIDTHFVHL